MKFVALMVLCLAPGYARIPSDHPRIFESQAKCEAILQGATEESQDESFMDENKYFIQSWTCVQVEGPLPRFPVLIQNVEGWDRA